MVQLEGHSPALCRFKLKSNEIKLNCHAYYLSIINFKNPLLQSSSPIRPHVFGLPCWKAQIQWQDVAAVTESWIAASGSQTGAISAPGTPGRAWRGVLGDGFVAVVTTGGCHWDLAGRGQGCCTTSCRARHSSASTRC